MSYLCFDISTRLINGSYLYLLKFDTTQLYKLTPLVVRFYYRIFYQLLFHSIVAS